MQTIKSYLDRIKAFLQEEMTAKNYKLPQAPSEGNQGDALTEVQPLVMIGNIPHENFTEYNMNGRYAKAPYILLGTEECTFDDDSESIPILIQVCCYSTEAYAGTDDEAMTGIDIPDNMGTLDVYNLLENIREWLIKDAITFTVTRPIRLGSYDTKEATYPFSYGYLSFSIDTFEGKTRKFDFN